MRKLILDQGGDKWLEWRRSLLTATDAAQLLGKSKYSTAYQCYQRKLGLIPELEETEPMRRGKREEPIARARFNELYDFDMQPCCIESEKYPFLGASLDGLSNSGEYILEIKSQRFVEEIPEMHWIQMQHQMMCSDGVVKKGYYMSWWGDSEQIYEVKPDYVWMEMYEKAAKEFWEKILFKEPPALTDRDYQDRDDLEWEEAANACVFADEKIKFYESMKEDNKQKLIKMSGGKSSKGAGIKLNRKIIKGRVKYKELLDSLHIDQAIIDPYKGKDSESWCVLIDRKDTSHNYDENRYQG
jgi:putative phage-type endonuclease